MYVVASDPVSRIEGWIVQIEQIARRAIEEHEPKIAASWRGARAAHSRRRRLEAIAKATGLPNDVAAADRALCHERRALERAQPNAWFAAKNALTEAQLLRRALAERDLEGAVEAAFGAINAAWKVTGEQIDPVVQAGMKARHAAARGGWEKASRRRAAWDQEIQAIRRAREQMLASREKSPAEVRLALAERFNCSLRTIDRVLRETATKHASPSQNTLAPGSTDDPTDHARYCEPSAALEIP